MNHAHEWYPAMRRPEGDYWDCGCGVRRIAPPGASPEHGRDVSASDSVSAALVTMEAGMPWLIAVTEGN